MRDSTARAPRTARQAPLLTMLLLPQARAFYGFQIAIENIHSGTPAWLVSAVAPAQPLTRPAPPNRDVLAAPRVLHQGPAGEAQALPRHRELPGHQEEGRLGPEVDQQVRRGFAGE